MTLQADVVEQGIRLRVPDTGAGIAPEERAQLFQDFSRLDRTARLSRGFGLGLAITRHLVELMRGHIELESEIGAGSCFTVVLPLESAAEEPGAEDTGNWARRRLVTPDGRPPRILVAEDVATNQFIVRAYLERMGATVLLAADGHEAVEAVRREQLDLVVMDVDMPRMGGFEATSAIRALPPPAGSIPVVVATAHADRDTRLRSAQIRIQGYIEKPIEPVFLAECVQRALEGGADATRASVPHGADLDSVDRAALEDMLHGVGAQGRTQLLGMALRDLIQAIDVVRSTDDPAALARAVHRLQSLGPNFGAARVGDLASRLHQRVRQPDADVDQLMRERGELVTEGSRAIAAIERFREQLSFPSAS